MDKNILEKLISTIDKTLEKKGIKIDKIEDFKKKIIKETEEKEKFLIEEISKETQKKANEFLIKKLNEIEEITAKEREKIITAIKNIKIEPKIIVEAPIMPEIPTIRIPEIKVPQANIKVEVPKIIMPDNMKVEGLKDFIETLFIYLKQEALSNINRDNPLSVILTDEKGGYYKAMGGAVVGYGSVGGGGGNSGDMLEETAGTLKQRIAYITGTNDIEYLGEAQSNATETEMRWRIKKFTYSGSNLIAINWVNGETKLGYSWANRASYSYL